MVRQKHIYIILALSALFALIIQLPLTKAILFEDYLSSPEIGGGATDYYLSLINESSKGNWQLGSPYLLEWRDKPYLYPALNINAAGFLKQISGLDIKFYSLLMDYGAIFLIMALLLVAFLALFRFNSFGYLVAAFYIFFPWHIVWSRTLSPEINFIPFALFLIFYFWPTFQSAPRSLSGIGATSNFWKRELGLAVLAGFLFYIYPYYWTFALALLAVSDLWEFWNQKKILWKHFYKYLIIVGIASWYAIHLWQISQLPYYQETTARIGFLASRWPAGWYTQAVLLISLALFFLLKKYVFPKIDLGILADGTWDKIVAGLVTGLIVLNQQLVTGMQMEFNSHYLPIILIFLVSFWAGLIFIGINYFLNQAQKKWALAAMAILVFLSVGYWRSPIFGGGGQRDSIGNQAPAIINWFIQNNIKDKVVYAPQELNNDINLLTNNYLYFHSSQELQLMPTVEILDRFTYYDITNQYLTENLLEGQGQIFGHTFNSAMQKDDVINKIKAKLSGKNFVPATLAEYTKYDFGPMYKKRTHPDLAEFIGHLDKYQVSYLVYRQKDKNSIYKNVPGKIVFENKSYLIKKVLFE